MFKFRSLAGLLLIVTVLFAQVGTVFAAPPAQETTPITGTVTALDEETDSSGATTAVLVTLDTGTTYRISVDTAVALGLATVDPTTNEVTLTDLSQATEPVIVTIDPTLVIPDDEPTEPVHPISALLAGFFFPDDPTMAGITDSFHNGDNEAEQVFGFGVIAQALWMSQSPDGNADVELTGLILEAKQSGEYSALSDYFDFGDSVPTNWGQFKKELSEKKNNLGSIVSGHAENGEETLGESSLQQQHGNGRNKNRNGNHGHGNPHNP